MFCVACPFCHIGIEIPATATGPDCAEFGNVGHCPECGEKQRQDGWGAAVIPRLAQELKNELPEVKGFSERNIKLMVQFAHEYPEAFAHFPAIGQQAVAQLSAPPKGQQLVAQIPWGHRQALKDPYIFDFLTLEEPFRERELETRLLHQLERFLLELGQGFSFVGRQLHREVGDEDFYIDLLFYHLHLRCFGNGQVGKPTLPGGKEWTRPKGCGIPFGLAGGTWGVGRWGGIQPDSSGRWDL